MDPGRVWSAAGEDARSVRKKSKIPVRKINKTLEAEDTSYCKIHISDL